MSGDDVVVAVPKTSIHEEIIREVEEIDWTIDPAEEEEMCSVSTAIATDAETTKECRVVEEEDEDFDVDELECVDETAEEERREREHHARKERSSQERRSRHSDLPAKYRLDRHHPYFRTERHERREFRRIPLSYRGGLRCFVEDHKGRSRSRTSHEKYSPIRGRNSSRDRRDKSTREGDEKDIPFDELELEEVDCYDELGEDGSDITATTRSGGWSDGEDEGDANMSARAHHGVCNFDDEFPDLCEEIDVDAMRRAAASNSVPHSGECGPRDDVSPPSKTKRAERETDCDVRKCDGSHERSSWPAMNGHRRDEARQRRGDHHQHYADRNEHRATTTSSRREERHSDTRGRMERYRDRDKRGSSKDSRPSTSSGMSSHKESVSSRKDSEIIFVKGPLAQGWCFVEDESPSSSDSRTASKAASNGESAANDSSQNGRFNDYSSKRRYEASDHSDETEEPKKSARLSSPQSLSDGKNYTRSPLITKGTSSPVGSPRRRDLNGSSDAKANDTRRERISPQKGSPDPKRSAEEYKPRHDIRSPQRKSSADNRRDYEDHSSRHDMMSPPRKSSGHHVQQRIANAVGATEKIPSLLDMCLKGLSSEQPNSEMPLTDSVAEEELQMASGRMLLSQKFNNEDNDRSKYVAKTRSLLDLDIPPPDRDTLRRYALTLNSFELTAPRGNNRPRNSKRVRVSPPRRTGRHDWPRQPRKYVHGVRR